jgi:hypothetical protein
MYYNLFFIYFYDTIILNDKLRDRSFTTAAASFNSRCDGSPTGEVPAVQRLPAAQFGRRRRSL